VSCLSNFQAWHPFYRREESAVIRRQSIRYKRSKHSRRHRAVSYLIAASSDKVWHYLSALRISDCLLILSPSVRSWLQLVSSGEGEDNAELASPAKGFRDFPDRNPDSNTETPRMPRFNWQSTAGFVITFMGHSIISKGLEETASHSRITCGTINIIYPRRM